MLTMLNLIRLFQIIIIIIIGDWSTTSMIMVVAGHGGPLISDKIDCLVNETIGFSDLKNVYQCRQPMKCCFEYSKPACCARKPSIQIIKEQLTLWGGLFAILFCLASIVYCRKKDLNFPACNALKMCMVRFCCGGGSSGDGGGEQSIKLQQREKHTTRTNTSSPRYSSRPNYGQELNYHNQSNNYNHNHNHNQSNNINHHQHQQHHQNHNNNNSKNSQDVIIKQPTSTPKTMATAVTTTSTSTTTTTTTKHHQTSSWHRQTKVNPLPTEMQQLKQQQKPALLPQQQQQPSRKTMADYSTFTTTNNNNNNINDNNNNYNQIKTGHDYSHQPRIQMSQV